MILAREWLKAERDRVLDEANRINSETLLRMCTQFYNLGFEVGLRTGRLRTLDEIMETLKTDDPTLSHTDFPGGNGESGQSEHAPG